MRKGIGYMNPKPPNYPDQPEHFPIDWTVSVRLKDGKPVLIRPIRPDDAPRLQEGFQSLSPRSIYLRFLEPYKALPEKLARRFARLDYQTQMAFVAETQESEQPRLIGVARYAVLDAPGPPKAESAVVVIDEYQRLGLGMMMMKRLTGYARSHGVEAFIATVHFTNSEILKFIERSGLPMTRKLAEPGIWEIEIQLHGKP